MRAHRIALLLLLAIGAPAAAQQQILLTGRVFDSTTVRPLGGALVALTGGARATRTDVDGRYVIRVPRAGEIVLEVRRLGYGQRRIAIQVKDTDEELTVDVALSRLTTLDTVRVLGAERAIYGVVGDASDMKPIANALVEVLGAGKNDSTEANGHFFIPFKTGTTFLVRAKAKGYSPQTMSVTVPPNEGLEISLLLDSASGVYPRRLEMALADFDSRIRWAGVTNSAVVPRTELMKVPGSPLFHAIRSSHSFGRRGLRFGDTACIFLDGVPRPGLGLVSVDVTDVEMIETYTRRADAAQELARSWPKGMPCGPTGMPTTRGSPGKLDDIAWYVVIWLKR